MEWGNHCVSGYEVGAIKTRRPTGSSISRSFRKSVQVEHSGHTNTCTCRMCFAKVQDDGDKAHLRLVEFISVALNVKI